MAARALPGPGRRRTAVATLATAIAAGLAGCASQPTGPTGQELTTEGPKPIEVSFTRRTLAVHFDDGDIAPRAKDIAALNVLLATGDLVPGDENRIERAGGVLADERAHALASARARQGLQASLAAAGGAPAGELRLEVEHAVTRVPNCPDWTKPPGNDFANTLHSDFGCASAIDLAAIVADPRDLVEGRPLAPVVGDAAIWPMMRYRTGAPEKDTETWPTPWLGATTTVATAPPHPEATQEQSDRPPAGATGDGAGAGAARAPSGAAQAAVGAAALASPLPGAPFGGGQP